MTKNRIKHLSSMAAHVLLVVALGAGCEPGEPEPTPEQCPATLDDLSGLSGTTHDQRSIGTDTTWKAADSPHIVAVSNGSLRVEGATLRIEPCAVVLLEASSSLVIAGGGSLLAEGTVDQPIRMARRDAEPWGYLHVEADGRASLAYVTLDGGGDDRVTYDGATLVASGPTDRPYVARLKVDHVSVLNSVGLGVWMRRHAAFDAASMALSVSAAGAENDAGVGLRPLRIDAQAAASIPDGVYTGNAVDEIALDPFVDIEEDATFWDRGVPYLVLSSGPIRVARRMGSGDAIPTLDIKAGVTLRFEKIGTAASSFRVGRDNGSPGSLNIAGTAEAPVTLTSAEASPAAGDWEGVVFTPGASTGTQHIEHAVIEYAGGDPSIAGYACVAEDANGLRIDEAGGVVIYGWAPPASFVSDTRIEHSAGWGVFRGWDSGQGGDVDFAAGNSFADLAGCAQNEIKPADGCPGGSVAQSCAPTP